MGSMHRAPRRQAGASPLLAPLACLPRRPSCSAARASTSLPNYDNVSILLPVLLSVLHSRGKTTAACGCGTLESEKLRATLGWSADEEEVNTIACEAGGES